MPDAALRPGSSGLPPARAPIFLGCELCVFMGEWPDVSLGYSENDPTQHVSALQPLVRLGRVFQTEDLGYRNL